MRSTQLQKGVVLWQPQAASNNTTPAVASIDTKGYDEVLIEVFLGATDIALTAMKLQESDDDGSTDAYADIATSIYGGTGLPALPTATDDNKIFAFKVPKAGRKRYLKPIITVGNGSTGAFLCVKATLSRAKIGASSATDRGYAAEVNV